MHFWEARAFTLLWHLIMLDESANASRCHGSWWELASLVPFCIGHSLKNSGTQRNGGRPTALCGLQLERPCCFGSSVLQVFFLPCRAQVGPVDVVCCPSNKLFPVLVDLAFWWEAVKSLKTELENWRLFMLSCEASKRTKEAIVVWGSLARSMGLTSARAGTAHYWTGNYAHYRNREY